MTQRRGVAIVTAGNPLEESGILIRGADGRLYFIPESGLDAYALDEEQSKQVASELDLSGSVLAIRRRASSKEGDDTKALAAFMIFVNMSGMRRSSEVD